MTSLSLATLQTLAFSLGSWRGSSSSGRGGQSKKQREERVHPKGVFPTIYPNVLSMRQMAALLTLATLARPESSLTISDMVRLFNSEALAWKSALSLLPPA